MSALAQRLAQLHRQAGSDAAASSLQLAPSATKPESVTSPDAMVIHLRTLLRLRTQSQQLPMTALDRRLDGEEIAPGLRYIEQWTRWSLDGTELALPDLRHDIVQRGDLLAFDTETTGLAGGAGTRAFMIGAADWRDGGLRIRQLCITTLAAESAMLQTFARWLEPNTILVSYNGKSYDRPLLSTRYRLARLPDPVFDRAHIDLLHPVRRRYRGIWANCRLATVERELLGVLREDDLPGAEAPGAWLTYLRGGDAAKLRRVGLHNMQDLRSLCGLLEHFGTREQRRTCNNGNLAVGACIERA